MATLSHPRIDLQHLGEKRLSVAFCALDQRHPIHALLRLHDIGEPIQK
jgi:hypothetical protein